MINNKKIIALIPARGGSKGIPDKNIKLIAGIPLLGHSINYAKSSQYVDNIIVSTDNEKISKISKTYNAEVINRPAIISDDYATTESAIEHTLNQLINKPEIIVLLQPTSPFRPSNSLDLAIDKFIKGNYDSLLSISPTHNFFWKLSSDGIKAEYDYNKRPRRQDMKVEDISYKENGSLYIFSYNHFQKTNNRLGGKIGHIIFDEKYGLEIDTQMDFEIVEKLFNKINEGKINDK